MKKRLNSAFSITRVIPTVVVLLLTLLGSSREAMGQPFGYSYAKRITLLSSQVSGTTQTNFPVLFSVTDNDLRTTANGGHVSNSSGYDIIFTSDDCLTTLDHQIESYAPTTGTYTAWVKVPTLSITSNTVIHMYYGNSSIVANPSATAVWDSNYKAVWHFNNAVTDNSANSNNLTDNSTSNFTGSKIASGRDLNNSSNILSSAAGQYLRLANGFFAGMTNFTFEGWVFLDRSTTNWERIFDFGQGTSVNFFLSPSTGTASPAPTRARITISDAANEQGPVSGDVTNTGSWIHWAVVIDNATSTMTLYRNGAVLATAAGTVTNTPQNLEPSTANYFGRSQYAVDHYIDAKFDEFRISTNARSSGWITTSYNNQNSPSTFYTVSSEATAASQCGPLPVELLFFNAIPEGNDVLLNWTTASEKNNEMFIVERSRNGIHWDQVATLPGAGTSNKKLRYQHKDGNLLAGTYYYRLLQIDYDGKKTYSNVVSIHADRRHSTLIYSHNAKNEFVVELNDEGNSKVLVFSLLGQQMLLPTTRVDGKIVLDTSNLRAGIYIIQLYIENEVVSKKVIKE